MFDAERWKLSCECLILNVGDQMFDIGCWMLNVCHGMLEVDRLMLNVGIRCLIFDVGS